MNFLKSMENGKINIKEIGIFKGLWIMILSFILETIGTIPPSIVSLKYPNIFGQYGAYVNFGLGVIIKFIIILLLLKWFSNKDYWEVKNSTTVLTCKHFLFAAAAVIGYRLIYDNTLYYYVSEMEMNPMVKKAFEEMAKYPLVMIASVVIVAPIYEEVLFRGIILNGMSKKYNPVIAVLLSALFFALMHMNLIQGINTFLLAIILGSIYIKTGSIYLSIFLHFVNNSLSFFIEPIKELTKNGNFYVVSGIQITVGLIFLIIASIWYVKGSRRKYGSEIISFIGR